MVWVGVLVSVGVWVGTGVLVGDGVMVGVGVSVANRLKEPVPPFSDKTRTVMPPSTSTAAISQINNGLMRPRRLRYDSIVDFMGGFSLIFFVHSGNLQ